MSTYETKLEISDGETIEYNPPMYDRLLTAAGQENPVSGVLKTIYSDYEYHFTVAFSLNSYSSLRPIVVNTFDDLILEIESYLESFLASRIQNQLISTQHPMGEVAPFLLQTGFNDHPKFLVRRIEVVKAKGMKVEKSVPSDTIDPEDLADVIRALGYAVILAKPKHLKGEKPKRFEDKIKSRYNLD